jgi:hypothetical protein
MSIFGKRFSFGTHSDYFQHVPVQANDGKPSEAELPARSSLNTDRPEQRFKVNSWRPVRGNARLEIHLCKPVLIPLLFGALVSSSCWCQTLQPGSDPTRQLASHKGKVKAIAVAAAKASSFASAASARDNTNKPAAIVPENLASWTSIGKDVSASAASLPAASTHGSSAKWAVANTPATILPATYAPGTPASSGPVQPASMFDTLAQHLTVVTTTVEVHGVERELATSEPEPFEAGGQDVLSTAGTFGDVSRYLQTFPGVVATSDLSNEVLVRGGHPMENLFLVDGIEVPNINHLATMGTTGGFGPMIDSGLIQGIKMYTGGYDARYPERLSSVTEIRLLNPDQLTKHVETDFGIEGFGGLAEKAVRGGDLLVSAHHGLLEMMNSVGLGGLPSYTNELARYRHNDSSGNRLTILQLAGWDSIQVSPCESDDAETSSIDSQYSGWRETTGAEWQHIYSSRSFGVASLSDSEQVEHIDQQDQIINPLDITRDRIPCPIPASVYQPTPVYMQDSNDAFSSANYRYEFSTSRFAVSGGSSFWLQRPHFNIDQPLGALSPYSVAPVRADSTSFASNFSTGETGSYVQVTVHPLKALAMSAGGRVQTFAFGDHITLTPRLSLRYSLGDRLGVHAAFASYAQLPPYVYLLSFPENRVMVPMRDTHEVVGMDIGLVPSSEIRIEAYNKKYGDIPSSTEYPSVDLHDIVDMLGQQFVWLPMNSGAGGNSSGIEISDLTRIRSSLVLRGSIAYSRAMFAGLDHISRPSNFDFPWIANIEGLKRFGRGFEVSSRYGYATGRPYTPYDLPDSLAQNRPIYDVTRMNALRVPYYGRMDAQLNKDAVIHHLHLEIYAGVNNLLNRSNFLAYVWMPRMMVPSKPGSPQGEIFQMPIFPNGGIRYIFH